MYFQNKVSYTYFLSTSLRDPKNGILLYIVLSFLEDHRIGKCVHPRYIDINR